MKIQIYDSTYEKSWIYTKALSYLFSPFFDDMSRSKDEFTEEPYQDSIELIAVEDDQVVGLASRYWDLHRRSKSFLCILSGRKDSLLR